MAFFSTLMLEQAAGDAMMLSGLFGLCGLVLSLLAAVALRVGIRAMRQPEAIYRWQINAATTDDEPGDVASAGSGQAAPIDVETSRGSTTIIAESEPEYEPMPQPQPEPQAGRSGSSREL